MKNLIAAVALAAGLFVMAGTASAQHYGGRHAGTYGHGSTHGSHGSTHGGYAIPRAGVSYSYPTYGGYYQPGYGVGAYPRPVYPTPAHGGGYAGHGYDRHNVHHGRGGHR